MDEFDEELELDDLWEVSYQSEAEFPQTIYYQRGEWLVTELGLEHLRAGYVIRATYLDEPHWIPHMLTKTWVDAEDFMDAFYAARHIYFVGVLERPISITVPNLAKRPLREPNLYALDEVPADDAPLCEVKVDTEAFAELGACDPFLIHSQEKGQ